MRTCIGTTLVTILTLINSMSGYAQVKSTTSSPTQQDTKIELQYNELENVTHANLKPILLSGTDPNKLELSAFAFFRGKSPTEEPHFFGLGISSESKKEWFATNRELVFIMDGERLSLGKMIRARRSCEKTLPSGYGCVYWDEKLDIFIPYQVFARIVKAKKVGGEIGVRKFALKDSDLEILRNFDNRITPQDSKEF